MPFLGVGIFFFTYGSIRRLVGLLGRGISPTPRPLPTQDNTEQHRHTSMPRAGFELVIPMFERPKTVLALDRAAIETGKSLYHLEKNESCTICNTLCTTNSMQHMWFSFTTNYVFFFYNFVMSSPDGPLLPKIIICIYTSGKSHNSSVGIALGNWLDDRGSRVRFPAGAGNISLHHRCVHNGSGAHPASYPTGTRVSFPGGKAAGTWSWTLTSI
jgi:hypothetical protein